MSADTGAAPRFDVADPDLNWFFVRSPNGEETVVQRSPAEIIRRMQALVGASPDGNWGTGTTTALLRYLSRTNAPENFVNAVAVVDAARSLSGENGLIAWTVAVYLSSLSAGAAPDWSVLTNGRIALGRNATLSQVRLPQYGRPAPESPTTSRTPRTPATPQTPTPRQDGASPSDASASLATRMSAFYNRNKTAVNIAAAVLVVGTGVAVYMAMQDEDSFGAGISRGDAERAARLLGISIDSDKQSIRAAAARAMGAYNSPSDGARREAIANAREIMLRWNAQMMGASSGRVYGRLPRRV